MKRIFLILALFAQPAFADGLYIGLGAGRVSQSVTPGTSTETKTSTASAFVAGYDFDKHLAIEAQYDDLGTGTDTTDLGMTSSGGYNYRHFANSFVDREAVTLSLVGKFPVARRFDLVGRIGAMRWSSDVGIENQTDGYNATTLERVSSTKVRASGSETSGTDVSLGVGMNFTIDKYGSFRAEYSRRTIDDSDVDATSLVVLMAI